MHNVSAISLNTVFTKPELSGPSARPATPAESTLPSDSVQLGQSASCDSMPRSISRGEGAEAKSTTKALTPGVDTPKPLPEENPEDVKLQEGRSRDFKSVARQAVGVKGDLNGVTVAAGTDKADVIAVRPGANGSVVVSINGEEKSYTYSEAEKLVIDGGEGDDRIVVDSEVRSRMFITGGEGNDYIVGGRGADVIIDNYGSNYINGGRGDDVIVAQGRDFDPQGGNSVPPGGGAGLITHGRVNGNVLCGGAGADYIEGGRGNDLISGGSGNDVIYGMSGDDAIVSGSGNDYVDGGVGNDVVRGSSGINRLFGGEGDDSVRGGSGSNILVGGAGHNEIFSGNGTSHITHNVGDTVHSNDKSSVSELAPMTVPENFRFSGNASLNPEGREAFVERVTSDLNAMAAIEPGQSMLKGIGATEHSVSFNETNGGNKCSSGVQGNLQDDRQPGSGSSSTVYYNTSRVNLKSDEVWQERPPMVGLFHEMAHAYNASTGTMDRYNYDYNGGYAQDIYGVSGSELQAVGIKHRMVKPNPPGISENDMRSFLNLPKRERY